MSSTFPGRTDHAPRAFSLIGMLITLVCILVLSVILLNAMNKAVTGGGNVLKNTVRSFEDQQYLRSLHLSMVTNARDFGGDLIAPSAVSRYGGREEDTTASLFSVMLMNNYTSPDQLISGNEFNPRVWPDADYDWTVYDPSANVFWDPAFVADLERRSNVSFAHMPLFGERFDRRWKAEYGASFPILGNRGPEDGVPDTYSYTVNEDGTWSGHVVMGDGSIHFIESPTPSNLVYERGGQRLPDNLFLMEDGPGGRDAIIAFTKEMTGEGPVLQFD